MGSKRLAVVVLAAATLALSGCASPIPQPTSSPTVAPTPIPTQQPTQTDQPSPTPQPTLHVDGLATVITDGLRRWADPADRNSHRGLNEKYGRLEAGTRVLLVEGPVTIGGTDYWQLYPSYWNYATPLGWAPGSKADGTPNLAPYQPVCPSPDGLTAAQLAALDRFEQLACYGDRELTLRGSLKCESGAGDGIIAGPMLSSRTWCGLDGAVAMFGPVVTGLVEDPSGTPVFRGSYELKGHFDDPGAGFCHQVPFGTSLAGSADPGDPGAICECRMFFVVTSATPMI
jgi:hypothetical protein